MTSRLFKAIFTLTVVGILTTTPAYWGDCWAADEPSLLEQLEKKGVDFAGKVNVHVKPSLLVAESSGDFPADRLEAIAGTVGWEKFARPSPVAPVTIQLEYVKNSADEKVGHHVHSLFAVHTQLSELRDKDLMLQIFGRPGEQADANGMKLSELSETQLKAAQTTQPSTSKASSIDSFSIVDVVLLEKIRIHGLLQFQKSEHEGGFTIAWQLVDYKGSMAELQPTWQKIGAADEIGTAHPYSGWAGFISAARVQRSPEIVVVESRMLMHEPSEWFSASNYIRSKLPLVIQESARTFRRKFARDSAP